MYKQLHTVTVKCSSILFIIFDLVHIKKNKKYDKISAVTQVIEYEMVQTGYNI